jgi:hypothetical protein
VLGAESRAGAALAALVLTWVAVALLVLLVANLHSRLRRLESARSDGAPPAAGGAAATPYGGLVGRSLAELLGDRVDPRTRVLLVLSAGCASCRRLLAELAEPSYTIPTAVAWTVPPPETVVDAPVVPDGAQVAAALGVRVTPFGLVAGDDGRIIWAGPVTGLSTLAARARPARTRTSTGERKP